MKKTEKKVLGVIPARLKSSRIPEKMLQDIAGKKLIERTVERSKKAISLDALIVTTDSDEIAEVVRAMGVEVIMTDENIPTGTDRVAAALEKFTDFEPDIVVNIWGDEPLYPAEAIDNCVAMLKENDDLPVVAAADLVTDEAFLAKPSIVQVLTDLNNRALYFSRALLPFPYTDSVVEYHHVIGILAMRRDFLRELLILPRTPLEAREGVEQLRILEHGYPMGISKGTYHNLGVNTPEELEEVRKIYTDKGGIA